MQLLNLYFSGLTYIHRYKWIIFYLKGYQFYKHSKYKCYQKNIYGTIHRLQISWRMALLGIISTSYTCLGRYDFLRWVTFTNQHAFYIPQDSPEENPEVLAPWTIRNLIKTDVLSRQACTTRVINYEAREGQDISVWRSFVSAYPTGNKAYVYASICMF